MYIELPPIKILKQQGHWPLRWYSAEGLIPEIVKLGDDLIGCEIGSCVGHNLVNTLESVSAIKKVYAIDPFTPYNDPWLVSQDIVDQRKIVFLQNIEPYQDRVEFINKTSTDAAMDISDNLLDYVYIDGNHTGDSVKQDMINYYSKVKTGGILAVHNYKLSKPLYHAELFKTALEDLGVHPIQFTVCNHDVWYLKK